MLFSNAGTLGRSGLVSTNTIFLSAPLEIYSHALKGNKNIIHISFGYEFDVPGSFSRFSICDLPWVTSLSLESIGLPAIHRHDGPLFVKSTNNDLIIDTFATPIGPFFIFSRTPICLTSRIQADLGMKQEF